MCKDYTVSGETFEVWECSNCTLRFTQSVPGESNIGPYYQSYTYISHTDTEKGIVNKLYLLARKYTLNWKMRLVVDLSRKKNNIGELLDIGAGTGAFLHTAAEGGWKVTGLEPDEGARKICLEKYNLEVNPPAALYSIAPASFDVITMWHVLEHVHQLHRYLQEIKRLLKPGGVALIALPNYTSKDARVYKEHWAAYDVPRHLYHFSPKAMNYLAGLHQLCVEDKKAMWLDAFYIAMLSEQYKKGKGNLLAAFSNGLISNFEASGNIDACSSLVYVIRNKVESHPAPSLQQP